jgi:hypothetical protein
MVLGSEGEALVGMSMLYGYDLYMQGRDGGTVAINPLT